MHTDIFCGLDIGSSSIKALIGQYTSAHRDSTAEKILGFSTAATKGFSKGVVTNLGLFSDAVEEAITKVETLASCKVRKVTVNISGVHMRTFKSRGSIHISDRPSEITPQHVSRCIESAKLIAMSLDREVVYLVPERFYIDDKVEINEPLGLFGSKLDVDLNIITSLVSILQNLTKAINLAGYEVEEMVTSGIGTSMAIFDTKELEEGAVIIDIGKDITEASLFTDGKLKACFYFPFGSDDLTVVLQDKLKIMFEDAEELRIKCGMVKDPEISNLLLPRTEEITQEIYKKLVPLLRERKKLPKVSVVGGIAKMDGFIEVIERIFNLPVQMGKIHNTKDLDDINFACSLGLMRYGALRHREGRDSNILGSNNFLGRVVSKVRSVFSEYF